jgi:hypothetical protein
MTTISKHITALIHLHDCVIVPGLGAFVANYKPAQVVAEQGLFLPPKKEIGFNRVLTHNDGLLTDYIARAESISYTEAQKLIEEFVNEIFTQLSNKQTVKIDEIGELKKDAAGNLQFIPNTSALFLPEAFGFSAFHVKVPKQISHYDRKSQLPLPRTVFQRLSQRKLAASIALFTGLFLLNMELRTPQSVSTGAMISIPEMTTSIANEPSIDQTAVTETASAPAPVEEEKIEAVPVVVKPVEIEPSYFVIAGSFPEKAVAEQFKEKMISNGYNKAQIISINGKNRVAIEGFASKEDAQVALSTYRAIKGFESTWVLKYKAN